MTRSWLYIFLGLCVLVLHTNCSSYSESDFQSRATTKFTDLPVSSYQGINIMNNDVYMGCEEDNVQIGGSCNTGDKIENRIEFWLTKDGNAVPFGQPGNQVYRLTTARCDNGRWFAVLPRPYHATILAGAGRSYQEFLVNVQIFTSTDGSNFTAGELAPSRVIQIQSYDSCL